MELDQGETSFQLLTGSVISGKVPSPFFPVQWGRSLLRGGVISITEVKEWGLLWWPSGRDSMLPMQGAWVRSLVRELRSHMPQLRPGTAK